MPESPTTLMHRLHDEHATALWGYCLRLTGHDRARAEDVVQETLLRAWRNFATLDESQGSVRAWLFKVARNIVIDEWRTKRSQNEFPVAERPGGRRRRRANRPAAAVVGGRRCVHPAVAGAPRRAGRVLLPRGVGGGGVPAARRAGGHGEVAHALRTACPAPRAGGDGGGGMSTDCEFAHHDAAYVLGVAVAGRPARLRAPPGRLRRLSACRAGAGRHARPARAGVLGRGAVAAG